MPSPHRLLGRCIHNVGSLAFLSVMAVGCHYGPGYYGPGYGPGYDAPGYYGPMGPGGYNSGGMYPYGPGSPYGPVINDPNAPYIPGGSGVSPTPIDPSKQPPSTYDEDGKIKWEGRDGGSAPGFDPANPGGGPGRQPVPEPDDIRDSAPGARRPSSTLTPTSATLMEEPVESPNGPVMPAGFSGQREEKPDFESGSDPFAQPTTPNEGARRSRPFSPIQQVSFSAPASNTVNPYGRDSKHANPQWLRGVIEYDQQDRSWQIIYSVRPDANDPHGGCLTLGAHPQLAKCQSGDIVLVEGAIDGDQTDPRGKPVYVLDNVTSLGQDE